VGAHRTLDGLLLTVKNTGTYDPDALKKTVTNGIGLSNTRRRLHMLYGDKAELRIINRDGMVVTEVEIPREVAAHAR
jgi:LytS/YehU family sensor histidine kinase